MELGFVELIGFGGVKRNVSSNILLGLCQNLAVEKRRKCVQFPRLNTNRTWLQLIRSCAFLLDSGVPDFWSQASILDCRGINEARVRGKN